MLRVPATLLIQNAPPTFRAKVFKGVLDDCPALALMLAVAYACTRNRPGASSGEGQGIATIAYVTTNWWLLRTDSLRRLPATVTVTAHVDLSVGQ